MFPTDHPLDPGTMIGRSLDVDRIAMALVGGGNVVLAGPRRTGKTTVADAALVACQSDGAYVAKADLFECADAGALAHVLTLELLANRPLLRRAIRDALDAGKSVSRHCGRRQRSERDRISARRSSSRSILFELSRIREGA